MCWKTTQWKQLTALTSLYFFFGPCTIRMGTRDRMAATAPANSIDGSCLHLGWPGYATSGRAYLAPPRTITGSAYELLIRPRWSDPSQPRNSTPPRQDAAEAYATITRELFLAASNAIASLQRKENKEERAKAVATWWDDSKQALCTSYKAAGDWPRSPNSKTVIDKGCVD